MEKLKVTKKAFLEALESGNYVQTTGTLRNGECFCAEGLLCELATNVVRDNSSGYDFPENPHVGIAGYLANEHEPAWLERLRSKGMSSLMSLNDVDNLTFPEIAKKIRSLR